MRLPTLSALLWATVWAQPKGQELRPKEQWRPSPARDLSTYQARDATVDPITGQVRITGISGKGLGPAGLGVSQHKDRGPRPRAQCGEEGPPSPHTRIVGGEEAAQHQWPWQVAIHVNDAFFCGGSIISESYILTAAHCLEDAEFFTVMAGAHDIGKASEPHRVEIFSDNGIAHPQYDPESLENDIALIELPMPAPLNDYIKLACLPEKGDTVTEGDLASVTGWGAITNHSILHNDILHMVHDLPAITNEDCIRVYGIVGDGAVCLSGKGGKGPCKGDSGGPMIGRETGSEGPGQIWTQHGVVSFGPGLGYGCQSGLPNGFTRTEYYLDWIISQIS